MYTTLTHRQEEKRFVYILFKKKDVHIKKYECFESVGYHITIFTAGSLFKWLIIIYIFFERSISEKAWVLMTFLFG